MNDNFLNDLYELRQSYDGLLNSHDNNNDMNTVICCVCINGDISKHSYEVWKKNTNLIKERQFILHDSLVDEVNYIILDKAISISRFLDWANMLTWIADDMKHIKILSSSWIVKCIEKKAIQSIDSFLHQFSLDHYSSIDIKSCAQRPKTLQKKDDTDKSIVNSIDRRERYLHGFACVTSGTSLMNKGSVNNKHISDIFNKLEEIYDLLNGPTDQFRVKTYKKASSIVNKLPQINSVDEYHKLLSSKSSAHISRLLHGIGKSIHDKITEILKTGKLQKLENFQNDVKTQTLLSLSKIWGVGDKAAYNLYNQGFKSIKELRESGQHLLDPRQRIGLKHYEDLLLRIPRSEVEEIALSAFDVRINSRVSIQICGSYRRGKLSSGDIDFLIAPDDIQEELGRCIYELIEELTQIGFLTDHLRLTASSASTAEEELNSPNADLGSKRKRSRNDLNVVDVSNIGTNIISSKNVTVSPNCVITYFGVCKLFQQDSKHRRIDIKYFPRAIYATALLYFTGSDHFNRSMRLYASRNGYSLSDKGLVRCVRDAKSNKIAIGEIVKCLTEKDVFDALGLPWREPWERNCFDYENIVIPEDVD